MHLTQTKAKALVLFAGAFLFHACFCNEAHAQDTLMSGVTQRVSKARFTTVCASAGVLYAGSMAALSQTWYQQYEKVPFHFFNDNDEWLMVDKLGHVGSAYQAARWSSDALKWAGLPEKKAAWYGAGYSFLFLFTIEVFDGFSSGWGFSNGDVVSNTLGCGLFISQKLLWNEQRFSIKFSTHASPYANVRPGLLGKSPAERVLKDYNGQTYWLSANIACWLRPGSKFPGWLNAAVGYGAQGMTGGSANPQFIDGLPAPQFQRYPQVYLAPDIDFTRIKTRSKAIKTILNAASFLKFPLPALEYNTRQKFIFHLLYF